MVVGLVGYMRNTALSSRQCETEKKIINNGITVAEINKSGKKRRKKITKGYLVLQDQDHLVVNLKPAILVARLRLGCSMVVCMLRRVGCK